MNINRTYLLFKGDIVKRCLNDFPRLNSSNVTSSYFSLLEDHYEAKVAIDDKVQLDYSKSHARTYTSRNVASYAWKDWNTIYAWRVKKLNKYKFVLPAIWHPVWNSFYAFKRIIFKISQICLNALHGNNQCNFYIYTYINN